MRFVKVLLSLTLTQSIFSLLSFLSAIQGTEAEGLAPFLQTPIWSLKSSSWKSTGKELEQPNRLSTLNIMMILCYSKRNSNHSKSCYKLEYQYCGEHNIEALTTISVVSVADTPFTDKQTPRFWILYFFVQKLRHSDAVSMRGAPVPHRLASELSSFPSMQSYIVHCLYNFTTIARWSRPSRIELVSP